MTGDHGTTITFLSLGEKGLVWRKEHHNVAVALHACFVTGSILCKGPTAKELFPFAQNGLLRSRATVSLFHKFDVTDSRR